MAGPTRNPTEASGDESVNAKRAAIYEQVMEAQDRIAHALYRRGVANATVLEALDAADERLTEDEQRDDLYLSILAHYVAALGGRLEVRAVFAEEAIVVSTRPDSAAGHGPAGVP